MTSRILTLPPRLRAAALSAMRKLYGDAYVERVLAEAAPKPPPDDPSAGSR